MALVQERGIGRRDVRRLGAPWRTSSEGHVFRLSGLTRSFGGRDTESARTDDTLDRFATVR